MDILALLSLAREQGASDVHLLAGSPPVLRIDGALRPLPEADTLTPEALDHALETLASEADRRQFQQRYELDFGRTLPGTGRVRCNVARQQGTTSLVIRILPDVMPTIESMGLPDICRDLVTRRRGMVIVSGPTGSGKSTTLAAMIDHLNHTECRRIVTIEDPVEYLHTSLKCTITQRELGTDTLSFARALRHVLRQDPDVILVGEMRDTETAAAALAVAETGHLVLTTGHAPSAYQAVERVIDLFPPHERPVVQTRLASLLAGVLCQTLVPRAEGRGRVAAVEVMLANAAVRNLIRDGKIYQLPNLIRTHSREGMQLLDQALVNLYREKLITREDALAYCNDREELERLIANRTEVTASSSYLSY